jgi:hypothetical protein
MQCGRFRHKGLRQLYYEDDDWRLVFRYVPETNTATDLDLIEYH